MGSEPVVPPLSEDAAREVINRWSSGGIFRLRNMGDKIFIDQITPGVAYTIRLQTHYEQRRVQKASEPYHGGVVDDRGRAPGRWELRVPRPQTFEDRTETLPVPHTERVEMCDGCAGQGRVGCRNCMGQGLQMCPACAGRGYLEQPITEPGAGNTGQNVRMVRRNCTCSGGKVVCTGCSGNGMVRCSSCGGSGQVKTYQQLVVRFQTATRSEILDVTPVPDGWLAGLPGDVLVDEQAPLLEGCPPVPEVVAPRAAELLAKSHTIDEKQDRILTQLLHVERIPLQEVRYKYAGIERQLWICGAKQDVYAPRAPWNRERVVALVAGLVLAMGLIVGGIVFLVRGAHDWQ